MNIKEEKKDREHFVNLLSYIVAKMMVDNGDLDAVRRAIKALREYDKAEKKAYEAGWEDGYYEGVDGMMPEKWEVVKEEKKRIISKATTKFIKSAEKRVKPVFELSEIIERLNTLDETG